jgi:hypothetical protein
MHHVQIRPGYTPDRSNKIRLNWDDYQQNGYQLPLLVTKMADIPAFVAAYTQIVAPGECKHSTLDKHTRRSFKNINICLQPITTAMKADGLNSSHLSTLRTVGRMVAHISTRCSFAYNSAWGRHLVSVVDAMACPMKAAIKTQKVMPPESWRAAKVCAFILTHCLILDQLRFDCWSLESLKSFRQWAAAWNTYCHAHAPPQQITPDVRLLLTCCRVLDSNIQRTCAKAATTPQRVNLCDQRCDMCVHSSGVLGFKIQRGSMFMSCEHTRTLQNTCPPGPTLRPTTPMLGIRGRHTRGLIVPPSSFDRTMHRYTVIFFRMYLSACTDNNSCDGMRRSIAKILRACYNLKDYSQQFALTSTAVMDIFGLSMTHSHAAQLVVVDLLRVLQPGYIKCNGLGVPGENIKAVVWCLTAMVVPVITHAAMWDTECKSYYTWCFESMRADAKHDGTRTSTALKTSQFLCDGEETSDDDGATGYEQPYNPICENIIQSMNASGKWHSIDSATKFTHKLRCRTCVVCNSDLKDEMFIAARSNTSNMGDNYGDDDDNGSEILTLCSHACVGIHQHTHARVGMRATDGG